MKVERPCERKSARGNYVEGKSDLDTKDNRKIYNPDSNRRGWVVSETSTVRDILTAVLGGSARYGRERA